MKEPEKKRVCTLLFDLFKTPEKLRKKNSIVTENSSMGVREGRKKLQSYAKKLRGDMFLIMTMVPLRIHMSPVIKLYTLNICSLS